MRPPGKEDRPAAVDSELFRHFTDSAHVFDADGASDEQLAGRLMSQTSLRNVQMLVRDKPHASRRFLAACSLLLLPLLQLVRSARCVLLLKFGVTLIRRRFTMDNTVRNHRLEIMVLLVPLLLLDSNCLATLFRLTPE